MNILIACEESQTVTKEFRSLGFNAFSCDLKPCSGGHPEWHIQDNCVNAILSRKWDFIGFHPDCTAMAVSGNHKYAEGKPGWNKRNQAIDWTIWVWELILNQCTHSYLENPVSVIFQYLAVPGPQYVQPYNFGHDASKKTGLYLHNLPELKSTRYYPPRMVNGKPRWGNQTDSGQNKLGPSEKRKEIRSKTYSGIAKAMAMQWGKTLNERK